METEHFKIYYHEEIEGFARRAADAAEDAYGPVTSFYRFEPDEKLRLVLRDTDDQGFGVSYYYDNTMEIWATSINIDFELRGTKTDWLRNVMTHEFVHMISLQTARKGPRRIPALYVHGFAYQSEGRRDDVLSGYPNVLTSYAFPLTVVPPWFAEGTAQYMTSDIKHDRWDSHRDMILRMATLNDRLLTYDEMGVFGAKTGLGYEKVYDHGYSLVLYIANTYGEDKLREIYQGMTLWWRTDFGGAVRAAIGISGRQLHAEWKASLEERYQVQYAGIGGPDGANVYQGDLATDKGYMNLYPDWSPDGKKLAYISNAGSDYGRTSLFVHTFEDSSQELAAGNATLGSDWTLDGKRLVFARRTEPNKQGSRLWDLHTVDPDDERGNGVYQAAKGMLGLRTDLPPGQERLTTGLRSIHPAISPDGKQIAFVQNSSGSANLCLLTRETGDVRKLTSFDDGTLVYTPEWSPDGSRLAVSVFGTDGDRDVALISAEGGALVVVAGSPATERDPSWMPDGKGLVFSSDLSGVFDLYHLELETGDVHKVTRVPGGALQPDISPDGKQVAFAHYGEKGYEIRVAEVDGLWKSEVDGSFSPSIAERNRSRPVISDRSAGLEATAYRTDLSGFSMFPRVALDAGKLKAGFFGNSGDVLGKQSMLAGLMTSHDLDIDAFGMYEYRGRRNTLFLEFYRQTRHVEEDIINRDQDFRIFNRSFQLNEIDIGMRSGTEYGGAWDARLVYSRYGNSVDQARFNGMNRFTVGATYLNGFDFAFTYRLNAIASARDSEINPRAGRELTLRYDRYFNFFLRDFQENSTVLIEQYDHHFYNQITVDWNEFYPMPGRSALGIRLYGGFIDKEVDDFFDFHVGGLPYLKGYTFYSLEGRKALMARAAYRFPLWRGIDQQSGPLYSDQLFASVYAGIGRAWDGDVLDETLGRGWKRDVGAQIRFDATSFYLFPTRVSFDAAYGLDSPPLVNAGDPKPPRSGMKFYFTLLFGFLQSVGGN